MFSKSIILLGLAALAVAQLTKIPTTPIPIVKQEMEMINGNWRSSYETGNGIKVQEFGTQKQVGPKPEDVGSVSRGSYSYFAPDGTKITVNWVADENGFRATGDHLPTPPPTPPHVIKLLADLKAAGVLRR